MPDIDLPSLQSLLTSVVAGLGMGSTYALVALGFTLVYSATGYFHLAIAGFVTVGSIATYVGVVRYELGWLVTVLVVLAIGALCGALSERVAVRPIRNRAEHDRTAVIVTTMALLVAIDSGAALWFGSERLRVPPYWQGSPLMIGDIPVRRVFAVMIIVMILVAVLLELVMRHTHTGRILRAAHDDPLGVQLLGVDFQRVILLSFALAGSFAALAGLLMSPVTFASAFVGIDLLLYGFAAMAIGGFGSFNGAIIGASAIGLVVAITPLFVTPAAIRPIVLSLVVVTLLIRPAGLLGQGEVRTIQMTALVAQLHDPKVARILRMTGLAVALAVPLFLGSHTTFQLQLILLYAVAALAMYICMEVAGEFMVGHILIVAGAAYATAWFNVEAGVPAAWTLPFALVAGTATAVLLGLPGIRLSGFYLALFSFFAVLIIPDLARVSRPVTGGEYGLRGIERLTVFGVTMTSTLLYFLCLFLLVGAYLYTRSVIASSWGTRLMALRDAPQALQAAGVAINPTKSLAYLVSSLPASLAGWLLVYVNGVVFPGLFSLSLLIVLLAAVVAAGRNMAGAVVIGTLIFAGYGQFVGPFSKWNQLGLGVVLLLVIILAPSGLSALSIFQRRPSTADAGSAFLDASSSGPNPAPDRQGEGLPVASQSPVLSVQGISKSFGGNRALHDVSCEFRGGRVIGLVGANGSGKTTLVNVVTGFLAPDEGSVHIGADSVVGMAPALIARRGVTRTFQIPQLVNDITVLRNIEVGLLQRHPDPVRTMFMGRRAARQVQTQRRKEVDAVLGTLRLDPALLERQAGSLSLGMKRVVEIARALATGASIVCFDEPAAGLDEVEIERLGRALRLVAATGRTVVLIEHHMKFVLEVCDDVLVLDRGEVSCWVPDVDEQQELPEGLRAHMGLGVVQ